MNITRSAVLGLFESLNVKSVTDKLTNKALEMKVSRIKKVLEDVDQTTIDDLDETNETILTDIVACFNKDKTVRVVDDSVDERKSGKKEKKMTEEKEPVVDEPEDEDIEEEDEEEPEEEELEEEDSEDEEEEPEMEEEVKPKKKEKKVSKKEKPAKKEKSEKKTVKLEKSNGHTTGFERVGIVAYIQEVIEGTSKTKPIEKSEVLEKLIKKFPKRAPQGMKHTVDVQLNYPKYSSLLKKGLNIVKTDKGYYLAKPGTNGHVVPEKKEKKEKPVKQDIKVTVKGKDKKEEKTKPTKKFAKK